MRGRKARLDRGEIPTSTFDLYGYETTHLSKEQKRAGMLAERVIKPLEAAIVREVFESIAAGRSIMGTADLLNARGVPSPGTRLEYDDGRKLRWQRATIKRMLENHAYRGVSVANRWMVVRGRNPKTGKPYPKYAQMERPRDEWRFIPDGTPAIVDEDLWHAANNRVISNRGARTFNQRRPMLLRNRIRCLHCGGAFHAENAKTERRRTTYRCRGNSGYGVQHPGVSLFQQELDDWCWWVVEATLRDRDTVLAELRRRLERVGDSGLFEQATHFEAQLERLDRQKAAQLRLVSQSEGAMNWSDIEPEIRRIEGERDEATRGLSSVRARIGDNVAEKVRLDGLDAVMTRYGPRLVDPDFDTKVQVVTELGLFVRATKRHQWVEWALPVKDGTEAGWAVQVDLSGVEEPDEITRQAVLRDERDEAGGAPSLSHGKKTRHRAGTAQATS